MDPGTVEAENDKGDQAKDPLGAKPQGPIFQGETMGNQWYYGVLHGTP